MDAATLTLDKRHASLRRDAISLMLMLITPPYGLLCCFRAPDFAARYTVADDVAGAICAATWLMLRRWHYGRPSLRYVITSVLCSSYTVTYAGAAIRADMFVDVQAHHSHTLATCHIARRAGARL